MGRIGVGWLRKVKPMVDRQRSEDVSEDPSTARAPSPAPVVETRVDPGRHALVAERANEPKPAALETQLGLSDTRPSVERVETKQEREVSPLEGTMPSSDDIAFRVEDELDYDIERDEVEALLFGTPVTTHRIGRFAILERLGQGAMGTVYTAYDEELDRKVAVKVLRHREQEERGSGSARLLREAQAMARLSHPNIVGVHEVGRHEGRVFVAMEFVRGQSLDRWLWDGEQGDPRPWQEVLEVFRQAGEGLAAAHAAGVIHRDFKPHNVIRGDDGVVRVLDFGLARQLSRAELEPSAAELDGARSVAASGKLTATGAVMGTPAYMAPEQCLGQLADARADQFGFCAALFEGLYGQLPFAGENFHELFANVTAGEVREPPKSAAARVPSWVHRLVMRGLAKDPADRHASMRELVDALARDPAAARRRWLGAAGVALGAAAAGVGLTMALQADAPLAAAPCSEVAAGLAEVYADARVQGAERAVLGTGLSYARETWSRVAPRLDSYASEWIEQGESVCLAHHDGRMSSALFDRATACLAERRASLDALLELLERADAGVVDKAIDAAAALPALAACADESWLAAAVPRPADPELAAAVDGEREQLAASMVLHAAGRSGEAAERLDALRGRARALGDGALEAEAALARGTIALDTRAAEDAELALSEAIAEALALGHTQVASEAVSRRMFVRGVYLGRFDEAAVDQDYGAALLERLPEPSPLRWLYYNNAGGVQQTRNKLDAADALYDRALAQLDASASLEEIVTRTNRAQLAFERQQVDAALEGQRAAVEAAREHYGAEHPKFADYLYLQAILEHDAQRPDAAAVTIERALAILDGHGASPEAMRKPLRVAADIAITRSDHAAAAAFAERALAQAGEPDDELLMLRHTLGDARIGLGQTAEGVELHRQALRDAEQVFADLPSEIAWSHEQLSRALLDAGQLEPAREQALRAIELREADPDVPGYAHFSGLLRLGAVETARGEFEAAAASFARARAQVPEDTPLLADLAELELELARAMAAAGADGREAAERARASYAQLGPEFAEQLAAVSAWLERGGDD